MLLVVWPFSVYRAPAIACVRNYYRPTSLAPALDCPLDILEHKVSCTSPFHELVPIDAASRNVRDRKGWMVLASAPDQGIEAQVGMAHD